MRALWLSAAPPEAAGNHDVLVLLRVSAQQARCLGAADNQSVRAAVPPIVCGRLEFAVVFNAIMLGIQSITKISGTVVCTSDTAAMHPVLRVELRAAFSAQQQVC
ncbi:hypothetical protein Y032_0178g693 [Ancylostoma ceylanicum]|uniref:Uncharacterized protein n=1 Tax=Ancylostoma ceylanicum TaxID=53326 RepID=A0A016SU24_9BILA|nr:hypothetical protein Y032_0178g693 [Ancylostoma ceylanicum]